VAITLLLMGEGSLDSIMARVVFISMAYVLGFLMVSTIPYPSLKQVVIPRRKAFQVLALVVICLVVVANYPVYFLFGFGIFYVVLGPILGPWIVRTLGSGDIKELEVFTLEDEDVLEED